MLEEQQLSTLVMLTSSIYSNGEETHSPIKSPCPIPFILFVAQGTTKKKI